MDRQASISPSRPLLSIPRPVGEAPALFGVGVSRTPPRDLIAAAAELGWPGVAWRPSAPRDGWAPRYKAGQSGRDSPHGGAHPPISAPSQRLAAFLKPEAPGPTLPLEEGPREGLKQKGN